MITISNLKTLKGERFIHYREIEDEVAKDIKRLLRSRTINAEVKIK